ncbi:ESCRT-II complex subunit-domain-containing protein [Dipodascopsis tothii]|uniref:ESCRT-II complex subunit-domain-containing protein n=1 Tax=Dipodascopsis tothii TaxID=44089 RepID=UPI0034CEA161
MAQTAPGSAPAAPAQPAENTIFPSIYSFPPFFTRQPNSQTWASQLSIWKTFIMTYCRYNRLWKLDLNAALETELFTNKSIQRSLKFETAREILESLVESGSAEWVAPTRGNQGKPSVAYVYWKRPEEWANLIAQWVDSTGQKDSILTLYEIADGDLSVSQEFRGIDPTVLRKALDVLIKRGQAQIMKSFDGEEAGVKFF